MGIIKCGIKIINFAHYFYDMNLNYVIMPIININNAHFFYGSSF